MAVALAAEVRLRRVARCGVIETDAAGECRLRGRLGGTAVGVTDPEPLPDDHPLWDLDDVLITPHTAGATPTYYDRLADIVVDNVERIEAGHPLRNRVRIETG